MRTLSCLLALLITLPASAALVVNIDAGAETIQWQSGTQITYTGADIDFQFGTLGTQTVDFTSPVPDTSGDLSDDPINNVRIQLTNDLTGIRYLQFNLPAEALDEGTISGNGTTASPVFTTRDWDAWNSVLSGTYSLAGATGWDGPVEVHFTAAPIPEPATVGALLGLAALGLATCRRRR
ncbi:MAG: PEP-CTERM sorting domain-containing protein [Opitutales bacterium]